MKTKKKLLFLICALLDGGIDTILTEYLRNIPPEDYEVTLAIGMKADELEVHLSKIPEWVKVRYLVDEPALTRWRKKKMMHTLRRAGKIYDELLLAPVRRMLSRRRLRRLVRENDCVIDFDSTFYSALRGCIRPVIGFYHFSIEENLKRSRRHTLRQMRGMQSYTRIALICDAMLDEGKRLFPELAGKFVRIYNGYDPGVLALRAAARPAAKVPDNGYFLSVARLEESQKDITTLLHAYASMKDSLSAKGAPVPPLVLLGTGRDRDMLMELASGLGLGHEVVFAGFQPDAIPFIARSLALVHSSKYEGMPLAPTEAVMLGKPVIATDCPTGPAEILDHGKAGILTPVGDVSALAEAMERIATDETLRHSLSEAALAHSRVFDIHTSVKQLLDLCK